MSAVKSKAIKTFLTRFKIAIMNMIANPKNKNICGVRSNPSTILCTPLTACTKALFQAAEAKPTAWTGLSPIVAGASCSRLEGELEATPTM